DVLVRALEARGLAVEPAAAHGQPRAGVVVGLRGETAAAELLADLVREGVPVSHFAPEGSRLENAYLGLHLDRDTAEGDRP
ncbi:ABC transporter ATP-binding protein, partial [Micrococcus sp. HG099]|nr:ABC transporter ATP-binding protein [Micrococcus sp. HG099]